MDGSTNSQLVDPHGSDLHAIGAWLQTKQLGSEHSIRAYKAAAFSLREWLSARHQSNAPDLMINMKSMEAEAFVHDLFGAGALKASSIKHKVTILHTLYDFWTEKRDGNAPIAQSNPFAGVAKNLKMDRTSNIGSQRSLSDDEVAQIAYVIEEMAHSKHAKHYARTKLIWMLASRMALRREEIANLRANDFSLSTTQKRWKLMIKGKGRQLSDDKDLVIVPDDVMTALQEYRKDQGLYQNPLPSESTPLILRLAHEKSSRPSGFLSAEHVARIIKAVFRMAAADAANRLQNPAMEQRLLQASIHWGRHTWFMTALKKHPIHLVSLGGRHRDIRTTQRSYVSLTEEDLAKLAE
jgi:integrase